ncbi:MAG TPA: CBASS oligonucleotide cyclase [Solirubrobacterales bacterium]|nr:CBASS oligonucleotide cyclase [Solirubrobacterales bacterium]
MKYTDAELRVWDDRRLRVGRDKRNELMGQASGLIDKLEKEIPESTSFKVKRFRRAGSLMKATALYPRADIGIDADIAVFLDDSEASDWDLSTLHATLREIAIKVYPSKSAEDFWVQPHTLGMEFRASGLKVDLVPLLAIEGDTERGWMVDSSGQRSHIADVPAHIKFVRDLANEDGRYRPLVRMAKRWRSEADLKDELGSFPIELILAQLNSDLGPPATLEEGLHRLFLYIAQTELRKEVLSGHASAPSSQNPVVILDPADRDNNVAALITDTERAEIVSATTSAWETLVTASQLGGKGETEELWREVFGTNFTTEEEK